MVLLIPQIRNRALLAAAAAPLVQRTAGQMKRFRKEKAICYAGGQNSFSVV